MRSSCLISAGLCTRLISASFLILFFHSQSTKAANIKLTVENTIVVDADALANLNLPLGGQDIQISDAQMGINCGGNATTETGTLYSISPDNANEVHFYQSNTWPHKIVPGKLTIDKGISATVAKNEDGAPIVNGWPASQFTVDLSAGNANGVNGVWFYFSPNENPSGDACIEVFDCPELSANIGDLCDDGDPTTQGDTVMEDCNCTGMPLAPGSIHVIIPWNAVCGVRSVVITLYELGTTFISYGSMLEIDETGYVQTDEVPYGNYDVIVKVQGFLAIGIADFHLMSGDNLLEITSMTGGDVNNNNAVNLSDISTLSAAFGSMATDSNYNLISDFNCNGIINFVDVSILGISFGMVGDTAPLTP